MAYDLEQQEQLATFKEWWRKYGNLLTWTLIVVLAGYASWTGWKLYQANQTTRAAQLYEELENAVLTKDNARIQRAADDMESQFKRTAYAQMAGLVAAKAAFDANDLKVATSQLQWVIEHAKDAEYQALAKIRLAGVYLDQKAYEDGLKVLSGSFLPAFESAVADRRGDILVAQNKIDEARSAYQLALEKMGPKDPGRQLLQLKLDAIGGTTNKVTG
ncbi:MAG: tetratricopeptide repeat protein [Herbaspirillum sp.]